MTRLRTELLFALIALGIVLTATQGIAPILRHFVNFAFHQLVTH